MDVEDVGMKRPCNASIQRVVELMTREDAVVDKCWLQ